MQKNLQRKDDGKDYVLNFVLKQETEWELGIIYQAQKSMDYIIEEEEEDPLSEFDAASYT